MLKKIVSGIMLTLLLMCLFTIVFRVKSAKAALELPIVSGSNTVVCVGQVFDFNITINDLDVGWEMIKFMLFYYLGWEGRLELLDIKEGPFLLQFPNTPTPPYTYPIGILQVPPNPYFPPSCAVANILSPDPPDPETGNWTVFPEGGGTLAIFTFKAIAVGDVTILPYISILENPEGEEMPHEVLPGFVEVREPLPGDLNLDSKVDIKDIAVAASAFGSFLGHPKWNPIADINNDDKVDIKDLALIAMHFGEVYS